MTGPFLHSLEISKLRRCQSTIKDDSLTYGIHCVKTLLDYQEINVQHTSDIARLKRDATRFAKDSPTTENTDVVVIMNATLVTMETGQYKSDIIEGAMIIVRGGVIEFASQMHEAMLPGGVTVIDAQGGMSLRAPSSLMLNIIHAGFIVPGFIDVHAHWNGFYTRYPAKSWEHETFLAYGVTTLHKCAPLSGYLLLTYTVALVLVLTMLMVSSSAARSRVGRQSALEFSIQEM